MGTIIPKIKISENVGKITNPHFKTLYRLYDKETGKAIADYICVHDEKIDEAAPLDDFRSGRDLEAQDHPQLYGPAPAGAGLPERQAGLPAARSWMTSGHTACSRSIRSGMRSSALIIRTSIMSTCPSGFWDIKNELLQRNAGC